MYAGWDKILNRSALLAELGAQQGKSMMFAAGGNSPANLKFGLRSCEAHGRFVEDQMVRVTMIPAALLLGTFVFVPEASATTYSAPAATLEQFRFRWNHARPRPLRGGSSTGSTKVENALARSVPVADVLQVTYDRQWHCHFGAFGGRFCHSGGPLPPCWGPLACYPRYSKTRVYRSRPVVRVTRKVHVRHARPARRICRCK